MTELAWRRASACGEAGHCVEVAEADGNVLVRDSKDPDGPVLRFTHAEWDTFKAGMAAGEF